MGHIQKKKSKLKGEKKSLNSNRLIRAHRRYRRTAENPTITIRDAIIKDSRKHFS